MTTHRRILLLLLAGYLAITVGYGIVNPLFEAPDEPWHYFTAQYIADNGRLPVVEPVYDRWMNQEAAQPPLYYMIGALLIRAVETGNPQEQVWLNPHFFQSLGNAAAVSNRNAVIHTNAEHWPWQGYVLAAHLLRLMSTLFGLGTLLCLYACGRLIWPEKPTTTLVAVGLTAFLPQYNFQHAAVSNDTMITFLASLVLWQLLRLWRARFQTINYLALLGVGITTGLAALTKNTGVLLAVYVVLFLIWTAVRRQQSRRLPAILTTFVIPVFLIAGWLWWRNWTLYGDPTAANQFIRLAGGDRNYSPMQILAETPGLWNSLFAVFGWFNVRAQDWVFWIWYGICFWGLAGLIWLFRSTTWQKYIDSPILWLTGWPIVVYAGLFQFMLKTPAAQGRLLFPALIPLALGLAFGLTYEGRYHPSLPGILWPGLALATTLTGLLFVLPPVYAPPKLLAKAEALAIIQNPTEIVFAEKIRLLGTAVSPTEATSGQSVQVTACWHALADMDINYTLYVRLLDSEFNSLGQRDTYPGLGKYPTSLWQTGDIFCDTTPIPITGGMIWPTAVTLDLGFYDLETDDSLPAANLDGDPVNQVVLGQIKIKPASPPPMPSFTNEADAAFARGVRLLGYTWSSPTAKPGETVTLELVWQAAGPLDASYTAFAHLLNADGEILVQDDHLPRHGRYPTNFWGDGDIIVDNHTFTLPKNAPTGPTSLRLGFYQLESLQRLPRASSTNQPDFALLTGPIISTTHEE